MAAAAAASLPAGYAADQAIRGFHGAAPPVHRTAVIAATTALFCWAAAFMPTDWRLAATCALGWSLLVSAVVDQLDYRLPDLLTLPMMASGLLLSFLLPDARPLDHLAGAAVGYGSLTALAAVYRLMRHREGLGPGDAKLLAAVGAWMGWKALPAVVLIGCVAALALFLVRLTWRPSIGADARIPFGPPLCLAFWLSWLYGPPTLG